MMSDLFPYFVAGVMVLLLVMGLYISRDPNKRDRDLRIREKLLNPPHPKWGDERKRWLEIYETAKATEHIAPTKQGIAVEPTSQASSSIATESRVVDAKFIMQSVPPVQPRPIFESPLEEKFWEAWQAEGGPNILELTYQYEVIFTPYRVDFAHLPTKIAIELDGFSYHSSKEQFIRDKKRERDLTRHGWRVIRFSGSEVNSDPSGCFRETLQIVKAAAQIE